MIKPGDFAKYASEKQAFGGFVNAAKTVGKSLLRGLGSVGGRNVARRAAQTGMSAAGRSGRAAALRMGRAAGRLGNRAAGAATWAMNNPVKTLGGLYGASLLHNRLTRPSQPQYQMSQPQYQMRY